MQTCAFPLQVELKARAEDFFISVFCAKREREAKDFDKVYCTRCLATRTCIQKKELKKTRRYFKETKLKVETKLTATAQESLKNVKIKERAINTNQLNFHQDSIRS